MVTDTQSIKSANDTLKFLCSYGGRIVPRSTDGKLRYSGGLTRVLAVSRSVSFAELMVKLSEFCGYSVTLRCQLPKGDLETLVSIKSDEDLANIVEEYDHVGPGTQIRAILSPHNSIKQISPPSSPDSSYSGWAVPSPTTVMYGPFSYRNHARPARALPRRCYGDSGTRNFAPAGRCTYWQ